jgi:4-alpha-glucanotransferase
MPTIPDDLARLADAYGVATSYLDWSRRPRPVSEDAVRLALAAMEVASATPQQIEASLEAVAARPWQRVVPFTTVAVVGDPERWTLRVHVPRGTTARAVVRLEGGGEVALAPPGDVTATGAHAGTVREAREICLPDLPLGYHRVVVAIGEEERGGEEGLLVVAPAACPGPDRLAPSWGWMLQLYALRSAASWGIGDLADLATIVRWSGEELGADFVVVNPLHAPAPTLPVEPSPYYPSSRRFVSPLMLRPEALPCYGAAPPEVRAAVDELAAAQRANNRDDRIDRDAAWTAKLEALALLHGIDDGLGEQRAAHASERGQALTTFATFCALAERHGTPWQDWPQELHHPGAPAVIAARSELADRVAFHAWLQWCCDLQLAEVQSAARDTGMSVGVIHDLAVGVDPGGADAWALQDSLARDVTVGAPPDSFNQRGQDWRLPPLRPDRLAATGYAAFREMMAAVLRHAGGIRIDHILGLYRLWWVPEGRSAADGTYVRYPLGDLLAILALEAVRADAVVIGEDLGTVPDEIRTALLASGVFSSRVVYFERTEDDERRLRADEYADQALASVTTHDLPTAAGWWADEAVRVQARLGLLGEATTLEAELARTAGEKAEMRELLVAEGVLDPDTHEPDALREALHAFLARCSARLVAVQPADAIGDLRQPNLPGTTDEYPNWRLPVAAPASGRTAAQAVSLETLMGDERVHRLAALLQQGRRSADPA